ncbi:MAG TPA: bifunctional serine/threonine-protein kinase/formylglycine-generating enzyme family protein [Xanthomonadales bacterium]|nr:bifunctional serine/threonine-protein kinase/formylglycine-generating enzyme family protein [Xanthomonadales bacterium]
MSAVDPDLPSIPGYAVEAALGSGGMATVYRARQLALDRPVAVKVLRAYGRDAAELNQRFEQEAKLIAALDHPHIVAIFEVTRTAAGDACYVMPLLAHGDLSSRPKPMPESEIKRILRALLDALGHAHAKGVVHRDVKPANVLFDARGTPLLADFGVAFKVASTSRLTSHGRTVGSSQTMSPEQARGEAVDGRSDLYSVGCLAFELLTGSPPFDGDDFLVVALKHQQEPIPCLSTGFAHWQPFFDRALAKRPEDRFADAAEMIAALEQVGQAPSARVSSLSRPASPSSRAAPLLIVLALALLAALVWWWRSDSAPSLPGAVSGSAASEPYAAVAAAIARQHWFDGSTDSADALLAPKFAEQPFDAAALDWRDQLLDRSSPTLLTADDALLKQRLPRWAAFVTTSHATELPPVRAAVVALEQRWQPALERARAQRDRAQALAELALAQSLPAPSAEFAELVSLVSGFPARGEPFRDGNGPELLLIPGGRLAGFAAPFAVSRFEITRADYLRFADASGRKPASCRDGGQARSWRAPGFEQSGTDPVVCVSHADAVAYAAWLSQQSGRVYRLPSLVEWNALSAASRVESCGNLRGEHARCQDNYRQTAPAGRFRSAEAMPADLAGNVREWTASCEFKEIGAVRKAMSNFGRFLQGKERDTSGRVCVGRYVAGSGWRDVEIDRPAESADADSAAVDRGFRVLREIR